ncbi:radical SAM protein [Candidatus Woesearchaeota archaeon]|nr:radical SAM protein [Candidatus Woesearchaeota archaeon]
MKKVELIQPRHNYAPSFSEEPIGHVYMPTSLLTAGARLLEAGVDIEIHDENIQPKRISSPYVGINLLGAPYIPIAIDMQKEISAETRNDAVYLIGGQVASGLNTSQFRLLFGQSAYNGNNDATLAQALGINSSDLKSPEATSLIPAYEKLPDASMKQYLSREFSLYVSQGCKFLCDFCAAVRSFRDPSTGEFRRVMESYRDPEVMRGDLEYLVGKARKFGLKKLDIYMSNLDVFQSPPELLEFAYAVQSVKKQNPGFDIKLRGLSTVDSFVKAKSHAGKPIEELIEAGFNTVGFGIDGMTPRVWRGVNKGINTKNKCLEAIRSARKDYGLTPEVLMVFGHIGVDTEETLKLANEFTLDMIAKYGAVPRPHVAKSMVPGNKGWSDPENWFFVDVFLKHPEAFQALDFTALPSELTHPLSQEFRKSVTNYYLEMCKMPGNTTLPTKPITPNLSSEQIHEIKSFNEGRYDR